MSSIKERILGAVTVMSDADAELFWKMIITHFATPSWDDIEEEAPDEIDLQMLKEIAEDSDCKEFVDINEAAALLGVDLDS